MIESHQKLVTDGRLASSVGSVQLLLGVRSVSPMWAVEIALKKEINNKDSWMFF